MAEEILITKKGSAKKKDEGFKVVSVRMRDELVDKLDYVSDQANRSRNEVINILLEKALEIVRIEE